MTGNKSGDGIRGKTVRVKTAKGRKTSSTQWLKRQLNDPYVLRAQQAGYRSRAAFKLLEMDDKLKILKKGQRIIDLGAAPGGWSQVVAQKGARKIVAIDLLPIDPIAGVDILQLDFEDDTAPDKLKALLGGPADIVLSDMSPNTSGHPQTDHLRIMALVEIAYDFAVDVLTPGGHFIAKVFQGGAETELLTRIKRDFTTIKHVKPPASRKESAEQYLVALAFRPKP